MELNEAKKIVEQKIIADKPDCLLLDSAIEEYSSCFVFYYQSKKYIKSADFRDMYVGQGPVLVSKDTGEVFETGSAHSTEDYVNAFEACGDPLCKPTNNLEINGWEAGANKVAATKLIKAYSGMGLKDSKEIIDKALQNEASVLTLESVEKAEEITEKLRNYGFKCKQLWSK